MTTGSADHIRPLKFWDVLCAEAATTVATSLSSRLSPTREPARLSSLDSLSVSSQRRDRRNPPGRRQRPTMMKR